MITNPGHGGQHPINQMELNEALQLIANTNIYNEKNRRLTPQRASNSMQMLPPLSMNGSDMDYVPLTPQMPITKYLNMDQNF